MALAIYCNNVFDTTIISKGFQGVEEYDKHPMQ